MTDTSQDDQITISFSVFHGMAPEADDLIKLAIDIYTDEPKNFGYSSELPNRDDMIVCAAFYGDRPLGVLVMDTARNLETKKVIGMCQLLSVHESIRGQGIGRTLVELAAHICEQNGIVLGGAYVDNKEQIELWKRLGFKYPGNISFNLTQTIAPLKDLLNS